MINDYPECKLETNYSLYEFFILFKYRQKGIGQFIAKSILEKFTGKWQLKYHPKNEISKKFWTKVVNKYAKGRIELINNLPEAKYEDGTVGHVMVFET